MANEQRKQQIAEAALMLFSTRGYHGTGMEDIAREIGMGTSSLYNHVRSKQEVLAELVTGSMQQLLDDHALAVARAEGPVDKLKASMISHVKTHANYSRSVRVVNSEIHSLEEPTKSEVLQMRRDYVLRWVEIVEEGRRQGIFTVDDAEITCYALIDMGIGVSVWFSPEGKYSAEELGILYANYALAAVGATEK
ncbi:TetR/AcrR family transcriptional regulator [Corynebacterium sp. S7]